MGERLKGKTAIITGAGSGIGAATAALFGREGAAVLLADRNVEGAAAAARAISPDQTRACAFGADISAEGDVEALVRTALDAWGRIDILVNNAAVRSDFAISSFTTGEFDRVFGANLKGPLLCCKHVLPIMLDAGGGSIVNVASISATCGIAGQALYAPSKGGVLQMTRQLAVEFASRKIRVNAVSPGTIETPLLGDLPADPARWSDEHKWLLAHHPIGRFGQPYEVATAILFLASDEASFITGANLAVDGGYAAQYAQVRAASWSLRAPLSERCCMCGLVYAGTWQMPLWEIAALPASACAARRNAESAAQCCGRRCRSSRPQGAQPANSAVTKTGAGLLHPSRSAGEIGQPRRT